MVNKDCEQLRHIINAFTRKGREYNILQCFEIAVVPRGKTLDESVASLREAVLLHLEGEDLEELGLTPQPTLLITMELEPLADAA